MLSDCHSDTLCREHKVELKARKLNISSIDWLIVIIIKTFPLGKIHSIQESVLQGQMWLHLIILIEKIDSFWQAILLWIFFLFPFFFFFNILFYVSLFSFTLFPCMAFIFLLRLCSPHSTLYLTPFYSSVPSSFPLFSSIFCLHL